jgi:hypothetical protein
MELFFFSVAFIFRCIMQAGQAFSKLQFILLPPIQQMVNKQIESLITLMIFQKIKEKEKLETYWK